MEKAEREEYRRIHESLQEITAMLRLLHWYWRQKDVSARIAREAMTERARRHNAEFVVKEVSS